MPMIEELEDSPQAGLCCPRCAAANSQQRKFCAKCGAELWESCLRCGELCASAETYCGGCGANLDEIAADAIERIEDDFRVAAQMQAECRYNQAIARLVPLSKHVHPRLVEYAARAKILLSRLPAEREQRRAEAEEACRRARRLHDSFDFEGAARILETVSEPLRNNEILELIALVAERRREIASLEDELREAALQKRLLGILPKIERLLLLKPDHAHARRLAIEVQKRLVSAAEKHLAKHHYDQAVKLLEQISPRFPSQDVEGLYRKVKELAWLSWDLRNAPVVDGTLVAVARRLRQMAPDDAEAIKLCRVLHRRLKQAKTRPSNEPLPWARPPQRTALDVPVDWLTRFHRLGRAEAADLSELHRQPGRFAVACGLALAGIKQAAVEINLLPTQERGLMHSITRLVRSSAAREAWGIDIGSSALKAVKLRWHERQRKTVLEDALLIEHAKFLTYAANDAEKRRLVADSLQAFLDRREIKAERVCVGLPARTTLSRQIDLPPVDAAKASKLISLEATHQFPFPLDQLTWDYKIFNDFPTNPDRSASKSGPMDCRALLIAARQSTTGHFLDAFQRLGMRVDALQPDFVALHNFLAYDCFPPPGNAPSGEAGPVVAALDVGCDVTNIVVCSPNSLWFRSLGVAGHSFTRALVKDFNLSIAQAEQRKRVPESAECFNDIYESLSPVFDDLLKEVQQSLAAYGESQPNRPVQLVLGLGGGFSSHGLFRRLRCGR